MSSAVIRPNKIIINKTSLQLEFKVAFFQISPHSSNAVARAAEQIFRWKHQKWGDDGG